MKAAPISIVFLALTAAQPASAPIAGLWKNPIGSAIIAIAPCGTAYCGTVVWASARGQREVAKTTPNVIGTKVLTDLRPADGRWTGNLFIPDDNIHVTARLRLLDHRRLELTGCAVLRLICRTQLWTRSEEPLPSAD